MSSLLLQTCTFSSALPFRYMSCLSLSFISLNGSMVPFFAIRRMEMLHKNSHLVKRNMHATRMMIMIVNLSYKKQRFCWFGVFHVYFYSPLKKRRALKKKMKIHSYFSHHNICVHEWFYFRQINAMGVFLFWIIIFLPFLTGQNPSTKMKFVLFLSLSSSEFASWCFQAIRYSDTFRFNFCSWFI